jgi:sialate O-acetylesterase
MKNLWTRTVVVLAILAMAQVGRGEVKLPSIFASHMVLQQQKPIVVWGTADADEKVTVQIGTAAAQTTTDATGKWKVSLPAMTAGGPHTLTVTASNKITLEDVLVGEVWICSGQSNMEMGVTLCLNGKQEVENANHPNIRLFLVPKTIAATPQQNVPANWVACSPQTIAQGGWGGFSASAYFFGRELNKQLNVPIGLIAPSWGGTRIEPWTPLQAFATIPSLKNIYDQYSAKEPHHSRYKQEMTQYLEKMNQWMDKSRQELKQDDLVSVPPAFPSAVQFDHNPQTPTALYNAMIHPLVPLSIRGAIWYQGESNHDEGMAYTDKMKALITGWRSAFNQPDFPFYYVQIAPFMYDNEPSDILPIFWEAQAAVMPAVPNTGMVVTTDIAETRDIHPRNKQEVGRRLALWALAKTYHKSNIIFSGPTFKSMKIEGDKLRVTFENVGGGLVSRDNKPLTHFEIYDQATGKYVAAKAVIDGPDVILSADGVKKTAAMRFGWHKLAEPNLNNQQGLPAAPFRAGEIPKPPAHP